MMPPILNSLIVVAVPAVNIKKEMMNDRNFKPELFSAVTEFPCEKS